MAAQQEKHALVQLLKTMVAKQLERKRNLERGRQFLQKLEDPGISQGEVQDIIKQLANKDAVFISYARSDWDTYVSKVVAGLARQGTAFWIDKYLIRTGEDWLDEIGKALNTCDRMILVVTQSALNSAYVKKEYRYFLNHRDAGNLYPILCEQLSLPFELDDIQHTPFEALDSVLESL